MSWKVTAMIPFISLTLVNAKDEELILSADKSESVFAKFINNEGEMTVSVGDEINENKIPVAVSKDGRLYCAVRGKVQERLERLLDQKARVAARNVKFDKAAREAKLLQMMDEEAA